MASSVYSIRMAGGVISGNGLLATVPVGKVWIVRNATCRNATNALVSNVVIYSGQGSSVVPVYGVPSLAVGEVSALDTRVVLNAGESLRYNIVSGSIQLALSGYELTD